MTIDRTALRHLASLLEQRTGQQIGPNRLWRIETVLKSLMRERGIPNLDALVGQLNLGRDVMLASEVVEALLNNETFFFRDAQAFDLVRNGALEALRQARAASRRISIWCAGCSTGQEAYSLAMIFADARAKWDGWSIDITATDVSEAAIEKARGGYYSQFEIQRGLPVSSMLKWFDQVGDEWRVKRDLARYLRFRRHNVLMAQTGSFDLILCRNVLLYFSPERRREAFDRLAASLAPDGYLMLGAGETVIGQTDAFASAPELRGLYRKTAAVRTKAA
ncbi:methyltransferase domain-containing protein [Sphingomonas sp. MAH-20]|uniref:Methyltransferase domain-containing protein n=1 Tax=Sphingomonas horti TaxID=2682842 RepID=A0A6I4IWR7_9SPHN|nr:MULTISPECIES: protein-glutamate O-methyltransferase CheR [Sphingomonas]MBA2920293.1 protein-glutamate O-methyltransferase CheR [Sphingomonas sp. CGMCC 1.13658]MVO76547.1 methyltransferase domain-containing protein [Sphingomonas horti]